tara:strand:+ start:58 stop:672 length:615 start_codon:yes stop_codon:yes gene_type:complete
MTLTSSGQISMSDIRTELDDSGEIKLKEASDGTVATINTLNASSDRPDGSAPHAMSEFYSYNHDAATTVGNPSDTSIAFSGTAGDGESTHAAVTSAITYGSGGLDIWYTNNSGTVRGGLDVALSTDGTNYGSDIDVQNSSGYFSDGLSDFSGSSTLYMKFKYTPHGSLAENTSRTLNIKLNGVTNTGATITTFYESAGGGGGGR